jgi:hypothetical protein
VDTGRRGVRDGKPKNERLMSLPAVQRIPNLVPANFHGLVGEALAPEADVLQWVEMLWNRGKVQ